MEERNIIFLGGEPGSGKSTLGKSLAKAYHSEIDQQRHSTPSTTPYIGFDRIFHETATPYASHVSLGQYVRKVYAKQTNSYYYPTVKKHLESDDPYNLLDDLVAYGLTLEALLHRNDSELILLDGYPRRASQVDDIAIIAGDLGFNIRGMIVTESKEAKARHLKRGRDLGRTATGEVVHSGIPPERVVERRFQLYEQYMPETISNVNALGISIEHIDTSGTKDQTLKLGKEAAARFLQQNGAARLD